MRIVIHIDGRDPPEGAVVVDAIVDADTDTMAVQPRVIPFEGWLALMARLHDLVEDGGHGREPGGISPE